VSTIKSSAENLTLNADGSNNDIIFQSNGSNVATLDQAGLLTATTFAGSAASLTAIPAANITGTLPAISGANLTSLPAQGITECDQWRLTTDFQGNAEPIASNLERNDCNSFGLLGTGMTQSSGIFTFPSTGYWLVGYQVLAGTNFSAGSETQGCWAQIATTINNSTYVNVSDVQQGTKNFNTSYVSGITMHCQSLIDVTDTANVKVRFGFGAGQGGEWCRGSDISQQTGMTFLRLGDT
jgi:hypothetical protein